MWIELRRLLLIGLATAIPALTLPGRAYAQTSSWQQRVDPPAAEKEKSKSATKSTKGVKSQAIAPNAQPTDMLPGAAKPSGTQGPSLGPSTSNESAFAKTVAPGDDAAYEAFDQGRYLTALDLAQKAAAKGDPQAHTLIARIHAEGLGVPRSPQTAAKWYAKGAELGDLESAFGLGALYAQGAGVEKDYNQAARYFEMAASKGHPQAAYNLALLFLRGQGKAENPARAFALMLYAAEKGVVPAQYDVGTLYTTGTGTEPNAFEGAKWIAKAAHAGHTEAQVEYATILFKVDGPPERIPLAEKEGASLFRAAADKGVAVAQNRLARCYAHGKGVAASVQEAAKWHLVAKANGIEDEALEKILAKLSKADKAAAEKAAAEWIDRSQVQ